MRNSKTKISEKRCIAGVVLMAVFAVMLGIFLVFTPKYVDDYEFMLNLLDWYEGQGIWYPTAGGNIFKAGIPWDGIFTTWQYRNEFDNCRLSNITAVLFELLPKWVGSGLSWLSWFYAMFGMMKLARIRLNQYALVSVFIFLCVVLIPWRDNMGCMDYQFNYVLPSGLAVWLLLRLLNGGHGWLHHGVTIIVALLLGAWTEAFSVPILTGLVASAVVDRRSRCMAMWEVIVALCAGILWLISSPHFGKRFGNEIFMHGTDLKFILKLLVTEIPGMTVMVVTMSIYIISRGWKAVMNDRLLLFSLVSGTVSFFLSCLTSGSMRSGWWCALTSVFAVSYILTRLLERILVRNSFLAVLITLVTTGVVWCAMIPIDIYLVKTTREYPRALRAFLDNPEKEIFVDARSDMSFPLLSQLFHAQYLYWEVTSFQNKYFFGGNGSSVNKWKIIPEELKYFRADEGERIPGDMGVIKKGSFLIIAYSGSDSMDGTADIRFGRIDKKEVPIRITPFRSQADCKAYGFVTLGDRMIEYHLFGVDSVYNFKIAEK